MIDTCGDCSNGKPCGMRNYVLCAILNAVMAKEFPCMIDAFKPGMSESDGRTRAAREKKREGIKP